MWSNTIIHYELHFIPRGYKEQVAGFNFTTFHHIKNIYPMSSILHILCCIIQKWQTSFNMKGQTQTFWRLDSTHLDCRLDLIQSWRCATSSPPIMIWVGWYTSKGRDIVDKWAYPPYNMRNIGMPVTTGNYQLTCLIPS